MNCVKNKKFYYIIRHGSIQSNFLAKRHPFGYARHLALCTDDLVRGDERRYLLHIAKEH